MDMTSLPPEPLVHLPVVGGVYASHVLSALFGCSSTFTSLRVASCFTDSVETYMYAAGTIVVTVTAYGVLFS